MTALLRRFRRFLALRVPGIATVVPPGGLLREHTRRFTTAQALIHAFYAYLLYLAVAQMTEVSDLSESSTFHPLWPVRWLGHVDPVTAVQGLLFFFLGTSLLGAALAGWRTARILVFLGLLEFVALKNSYGKVGHSLHLPLLVSLLLIFLPRGWQRSGPRTSRVLRQSTLLIFWMCGAAVLLSYTMSGIGKLGGALYQFARWEPNAFSPGGLGAHIAQRLLETHSQSLLGAWIIEHPWLTWPAMPLAVYLEFFSFVIAFRPALARPWAALLVIFHVGNYFTMTIAFPPSCFLLALFFFRSPFDPGKTPWRGLLHGVPLAGDALNILQSVRRQHTETGHAGQTEKP